MKVLDLFSGIGGFSLGLERAGFETVAFCEIEKYPRSILKKHWPDVPIYEDVRKLDGKQYRGTVELICGGFPCQPFSVAGKQRGKEDDRHLWPEMLRLIREVKPTFVIGENVAGFITMALDDVLFDLESEGYTCQTFVIPACAVGGVHRRDRVWIVAYANRESESSKPLDDSKGERVFTDPNELTNGEQRKHEASSQSNNSQREIHTVSNTNNSKKERFKRDSGKVLPKQKTNGCNQVCIRENAADSDSDRWQGQSESGECKKTGVGEQQGCEATRGNNQADEFRPIRLPTEPPVRHRDDGLSDNVARLKALGNAVVPQIPEMIGRAIMEYEGDINYQA